MHVRNRNSNIQGGKGDFQYHKELLLKEIIRSVWEQEFAPFGSKFFSLREVPIFEKNAIDQNHCLIQ